MTETGALVEREPIRIMLAGGGTRRCVKCLGSGLYAYRVSRRVAFSTWVSDVCTECTGRGKVLFSYGPKDQDQRLYEKLYHADKARLGRHPTYEERSKLRERVKASRRQEWTS